MVVGAHAFLETGRHCVFPRGRGLAIQGGKRRDELNFVMECRFWMMNDHFLFQEPIDAIVLLPIRCGPTSLLFSG